MKGKPALCRLYFPPVLRIFFFFAGGGGGGVYLEVPCYSTRSDTRAGQAGVAGPTSAPGRFHMCFYVALFI